MPAGNLTTVFRMLASARLPASVSVFCGTSSTTLAPVGVFEELSVGLIEIDGVNGSAPQSDIDGSESGLSALTGIPVVHDSASATVCSSPVHEPGSVRKAGGFSSFWSLHDS